MYALLIAVAVGLAIAAGFLLVPAEPWYVTGALVAIVGALAVLILLTRRMARHLTPLMQLAQAQARSGNINQAIKTLQGARRYHKWVPGLAAQIRSQIGAFHFAAGNDRQAYEFLRNGDLRNPEGHVMKAAILYRKKELEEAEMALESGIRFNKKSAILYNFRAYLLNQLERREEAIALLEGARRKLGDDETTLKNLDRLRNEQRMNMAPFGDLWYSLGIESLPGEVMVRKGFRQKPKGRGRRRKR